MVEPTTATRDAASAVNTTTRTRETHASQEVRLTDANGPNVAALQRLQALADASPRVAQLQRLQALARGAEATPLQCKTPEEEELLQGRFLTTQRQAKDDDELVQGRFLTAPTAQRATPDEEQLLQGQFASGANPIQQRQARATAAVAAPNRTGMPDGLKTGIEALSGLAMDHVRVHYNSSKPAQLNAHAYAQGSEIHLAPGQDRHLPHEAWHIVQQAQGRVQPTLQLQDGVPVNDDVSLEREADQMGERALRGA